MTNKVTSPVMAMLRALLLLLLCSLVPAMPASAQDAAVSVTAFELVSTKRISRLEWESVYRARLINTGGPLSAVGGTATSVVSYVTVLEGSLTVGDLAAGEVRLSEDTITLRTNRSTAIDLLTALSWRFVGTPPAGDSEAPGISGLRPSSGTILAADALPELAASFADSGSGVDVRTLEVELDGVAIASEVAASVSGFSFRPTQPLSEGPHTLVVRVADAAGNRASAQTAFVTRTPPEVLTQEPPSGFLPPGAQPIIRANYFDLGSGVDTEKVRLLLDDVDVSASALITPTDVSYSVPAPLTDATHVVQLVLTDRAGNAAESRWSFTTRIPPSIADMSPRDEVLPAGVRPTLRARLVTGGAALDLRSLRFMFNGADVSSAVQISGSDLAYVPAQALPEGPYTIYVEVTDAAGIVASAAWGFEVDSENLHVLEVTSPAGGQTVTSIELPVAATVFANKSAIRSLTVNGSAMSIQTADESGRIGYTGAVKLLDGDNTLEFVARFDDGTVTSERRTVSLDGPPRVSVLSPTDKSILGRVQDSSPTDLTGNVERPVTVTGRVSKPVVAVTVNQQGAVLDTAGTGFTFERFFLREGMNVLTVVATDATGRVGTSTITVSVDQTAPILTIETPQDLHVTSAAAIDVRGVVNDAVEGMTGAPEPVVTVNGVEAQVADRYFLASTVPLQVGENVLSVVATDHLGNRRVRELRVSRIAVGSHRLSALSGNGQTGDVGVELPQPLAIVALDRDGAPVADLPVSFDVMRNTGSITSARGQVQRPDGVSPARNIVVRTDSAGRAQVWLVPGKQTGPGSNVVRAQVSAQAGDLANQFAGEVYFSATTRRGAVSKVLADTGTHQIAETGSVPLELLSLVVRDVSDNHLPGVPIVFAIEEGDAFFVDDNGNRVQKRVLVTDRNGLTATRPQLGLTPGTVRVSARALRSADGDVDDPAQLTGNAQYVIQVREARDGTTRFRGFVYTDKGEPLPGVRISVGRTSVVSTTDESGAFVLDNLPPGRVDLFVDGRTSSHLGQVWPSLHFEAFAVRGQENALPHPVYLPPLLSSQAKVVGGNEDVILTIPGIEGFQMKVKANSVTFPDGSRTGTLVVSPVTADKLPMAPPAGGAAFGLPAWTVQPAGTRFDPPIEVTLPNSRAYPSGDNLPVVQWDHDLGQFVPMGRATVSEDGALLVTDAGGGISKAGWGGLCVYDPDKCGKNGPPKCKDCEKLDESGECPTCKPDPDKDGQLILVPPPLSSAASIEYAGKGWEQTLKRLKLPVEASIKFKGGFNALVERRCCSKSANGVGKKVTASGFGDVEVEGKINWAPQGFFLRLAQSALPGLTDLLDAGLYSKLKGALSIGGKASYFTCDQPPLDGEIAGAATLTFSAIDAEMKFPGVGDIKSVTFIVGEAGISGGWKWTLIDLSEAAIRLKRTGSAYLFFKSELKWTYRAEEGALLEPSRKLTFVQASLPLGGDGMDTLPFE